MTRINLIPVEDLHKKHLVGCPNYKKDNNGQPIKDSQGNFGSVFGEVFGDIFKGKNK